MKIKADKNLEDVSENTLLIIFNEKSKSKILTLEDVDNFIENAPDEESLLLKVILKYQYKH